jgi:hypothetical protein
MTSPHERRRHDAGHQPSHRAAWSRTVLTVAGVGLLVTSITAGAEQIGSVDTVFKLVGPNHKIVVEAYDDPLVNGVTCHVSRAKTGGISGAVGLAEDPSDGQHAAPAPSWQQGRSSFRRPRVMRSRRCIPSRPSSPAARTKSR